MKIKSAASVLSALALLSGAASAQLIPVPNLPQQGAAQPAPPAPKLVPALGWDIAKQGGFTTSVLVDSQNAVWVGTEGNGLWRYDVRKKDWTQFTTKDGLGDDCIYALAVDKAGRIWAGHLNHGVSVYNGDKWRNYGVVDGPLGSRVFAIATCPTDGDVWIATEVGVTRYSLADDDWDYFTTASGLPTNQIQSIAFDAKGNIFLGTQCDGIVMADAQKKYSKWIPAPGLAQMPIISTGTGLGSNMINGLAMATPPNSAVIQGEAERLIVATPLGLSTSSDYGDHFNFIRGEDWQDNLKGLMTPPEAPKPDQAQGGGVRIIRGGPVVFGGPGPVILGGGGIIFNGNVQVNVAAQQRYLPEEDWVVCVHQEKETGRLWVGYRQKGLEVRNFGITPSIRYDTEGADMEVRSVWTGAKTPAYIAVYSEKNGGLKTPADSLVSLEIGDRPPDEAPALPSPAKAPNADDIAPLTKRLGFFQNELKPGDAVFIGDDWNTGGDWVGHYGTSYANLCTRDEPYAGEPGYSATIAIGPHIKNPADQTATFQSQEVRNRANDNALYDPFYHSANRTTDNPRVLYSPSLGRRNEAEVNDRSFDKANYPLSWEGPDLMITVEVPKGIQTLSLYFQNYDGHEGPDNKDRDYLIDLLTPADTPENTLKGAPLAHARVTDFWAAFTSNSPSPGRRNTSSTSSATVATPPSSSASSSTPPSSIPPSRKNRSPALTRQSTPPPRRRMTSIPTATRSSPPPPASGTSWSIPSINGAPSPSGSRSVFGRTAPQSPRKRPPRSSQAGAGSFAFGTRRIAMPLTKRWQTHTKRGRQKIPPRIKFRRKRNKNSVYMS